MLTLETLMELLGPTPVKVDPNVATITTTARDGYEEVKIEYNVEASERISAYLLIPKNAGSPMPAVFCHHQHASNFELGKSEIIGNGGDPDQAIGPELARQGYVVLAPDAIAFEERNWTLPSGQAEYLEMAFRVVKGETLLAKAMHDVSVGIDVLSERENVDPKQIGFIGHSYGGRMAIWAPALDSRIRASVSNCGCVNFKDSLDRDVGIQAEFCIPNIMNYGDVEDIVRLIAPRALYISATSRDKYSRGAEAIYEYARNHFPDGQLKLKIWDGDHVFTEEMRSAGYQFLSSKLQ